MPACVYAAFDRASHTQRHRERVNALYHATNGKRHTIATSLILLPMQLDKSNSLSRSPDHRRRQSSQASHAASHSVSPIEETSSIRMKFRNEIIESQKKLSLQMLLDQSTWRQTHAGTQDDMDTPERMEHAGDASTVPPMPSPDESGKKVSELVDVSSSEELDEAVDEVSRSRSSPEPRSFSRTI